MAPPTPVSARVGACRGARARRRASVSAMALRARGPRDDGSAGASGHLALHPSPPAPAPGPPQHQRRGPRLAQAELEARVRAPPRLWTIKRVALRVAKLLGYDVTQPHPPCP